MGLIGIWIQVTNSWYYWITSCLLGSLSELDSLALVWSLAHAKLNSAKGKRSKGSTSWQKQRILPATGLKCKLVMITLLQTWKDPVEEGCALDCVHTTTCMPSTSQVSSKCDGAYLLGSPMRYRQLHVGSSLLGKARRIVVFSTSGAPIFNHFTLWSTVKDLEIERRASNYWKSWV